MLEGRWQQDCLEGLLDCFCSDRWPPPGQEMVLVGGMQSIPASQQRSLMEVAQAVGSGPPCSDSKGTLLWVDQSWVVHHLSESPMGPLSSLGRQPQESDVERGETIGPETIDWSLRPCSKDLETQVGKA